MTGYNGQAIIDKQAHNIVAYFTQYYTVYAYRIGQDVWVELPRCNHKQFGVAVINGKLTAIGGRDGNDVHTNVVLSLVQGQGWEELLPPMTTARVHPAVMTISTHLVVAGGIYISQDQNKSLTGYETVELMALDTLTWSVVSSLPVAVRYPQIKHTMGQLVLCDTESGHVFGCMLEKLRQSRQADAVWTAKADIPVQQGASLVQHGNQILALGGIDARDNSLSTIYRYDVNEDSWKLVPEKMHIARCWALTVACPDSSLMVVGGYESNWTASKVTEKIPMPAI